MQQRLMRRTTGSLKLALHDSQQSQQKEIQWLPGGQTIFDLFSWKEVLQEDGDGGKVVVCRPKTPCDSLARRNYIMKMRSKASLERSGIPETFRKLQERLLNLPSHVGVLPLHTVFEDNQYYYMIMDRADGGSFLPSLAQEFEDGIMPETEVKRLVREILEALCHLHSQGMLHRDIKPDNLVMQSYNNGKKNGDKQVKKVALIDFDHADPDFSPATPHRWGGFRGTVHFSAPDAICGDFSRASDLYSVGVVLYLIMTGQLPYPEHVYRPFFEDVRRSGDHPAGFDLGTPYSRRNWKKAVVQRMRESPPDWDCSPWPEMPRCKAFCQMLMAFDARSRPASAEEALASEWLTPSKDAVK
jgi:serine/threonine protein kinase